MQKIINIYSKKYTKQQSQPTKQPNNTQDPPEIPSNKDTETTNLYLIRVTKDTQQNYKIIFKI